MLRAVNRAAVRVRPALAALCLVGCCGTPAGGRESRGDRREQCTHTIGCCWMGFAWRRLAACRAHACIIALSGGPMALVRGVGRGDAGWGVVKCQRTRACMQCTHVLRVASSSAAAGAAWRAAAAKAAASPAAAGQHAVRVRLKQLAAARFRSRRRWLLACLPAYAQAQPAPPGQHTAITSGITTRRQPPRTASPTRAAGLTITKIFRAKCLPSARRGCRLRASDNQGRMFGRKTSQPSRRWPTSCAPAWGQSASTRCASPRPAPRARRSAP